MFLVNICIFMLFSPKNDIDDMIVIDHPFDYIKRVDPSLSSHDALAALAFIHLKMEIGFLGQDDVLKIGGKP